MSMSARFAIVLMLSVSCIVFALAATVAQTSGLQIVFCVGALAYILLAMLVAHMMPRGEP